MAMNKMLPTLYNSNIQHIRAPPNPNSTFGIISTIIGPLLGGITDLYLRLEFYLSY